MAVGHGYRMLAVDSVSSPVKLEGEVGSYRQ